MTPDRTLPSTTPTRVLRFATDHPLLAGWWSVLAAVAVWDTARNGLPSALIWLALFGYMVGAQWVVGRLGTPLGRAAGAGLVAAVTVQPAQTPLLDRATDDVLIIRVRRLLGTRSWVVQRCPDGGRALDEALDDFADGYAVSTIPVSVFLVRPRWIVALDEPIVVRPDEDGDPVPDLTPIGHRRALRSLWFRMRAGSTKVTPGEVQTLAAQLRRAEPIQPEPEEDEHVAA